MAVRFPIVAQCVDFIETHTNHLIGATGYEEISSLVSVGRQGVTRGQLWYPKGVAIDPQTNQVYVTQGRSTRPCVSIFSGSGDFLNEFSHENMVYPWGIAVYRDSVYVTDTGSHYLFKFKVSEPFELVTKVGGRGYGIGLFLQPSQLTVSANGDVFVADRDNNRIQILDKHLNPLRHILHHSMTQPYDIILTPDEVFALCPHDNPCVHVFSHKGDKIRSLIECGTIGMQVTEPLFFCLDYDRNLVISDRLNHQIKIFSKEGALLHTLGERGHDVGMFSFPCGIAINSNRKLIIVSLNIKYGLQYFSI